MQGSKLAFLCASIVACTLIGCQDANRGKIVGTWTIDQADTVMERIDQTDAELADSDRAGSNSNDLPRMSLTFARSGALETATNMGSVQQTKTGSWELVSFEETSQQMVLSCQLQQQSVDTTIKFIDDDTISLVPPNMAGLSLELQFKRRKTFR